MTARFSWDELVELDGKVASAWLAGRLLMAASREPAARLLDTSLSGVGPAAEAPAPQGPTPKDLGSQVSQSTSAAVQTPSSSDLQASTFLEHGGKVKGREAGRSTVSRRLAPFVTGGHINVNVLNLLTTARVCQALSETELSNPALLALSVFANVRGYVSDAGAGLEDTKKQRKLAKGSDVFSALYRYFLCGFDGDLLPSLFTPYASTVLQVGESLQAFCSLLSSDECRILVGPSFARRQHWHSRAEISCTSFLVHSLC